MESKKFDITSTAIEKGIDSAKSFLDKLIMPAIEETGLLLKDQVTMWKFQNQVKMLNKAKAHCEKHNISPKTISLKLLCPLLDYSGIEEDETLQDKWAILLANMVDSEQNIENHVFPYILSQVSRNEFMVLEKVYDEKQARVAMLTAELEEFKNSKPQLEAELNNKIAELKKGVEALNNKGGNNFSEKWELQSQVRKEESNLSSLKHQENSLRYKINRPAEVPWDSLKEFELANVVRLGLVKEEKSFYVNSQTVEIPMDRGEHERSHNTVDLYFDVDSDTENILTELGELFINACKEKPQKS